MQMLLIFRFLHYILLIGSENLWENSYFKIKNETVMTFNIVHLPNFEISASSVTGGY